MYTLKNAESGFKKGIVKEPEKVRFSIYIPEPFLEYLESLAEEEDLNSRNQAVVETIKAHMEKDLEVAED